MVYDSHTFEILHELTPTGKERYTRLLENVGTEIIFRAQHPFIYWTGRIIEFLTGLFSR